MLSSSQCAHCILPVNVLFLVLQHFWLTAVDFKNINPPTMEGLGVLMAVSIGPVLFNLYLSSSNKYYLQLFI